MTTRDKVSQVFTVMMGDPIKNVIKKASTRIDAPPKRKHVQTLCQYLQNPRSNDSYLLDCLSIRYRKSNWVISIKALLTTHLLMISSSGEKFMCHISSRQSIFNLSGYIDRSSLFAVDMSSFVQLYALFLRCKCDSFRYSKKDIVMKLDSEKFDLNNVTKIFNEITHLKNMLKAAIDNKIDFSSNSPLIQTVQMFLLKECLRVYSAFNRRTIFLLENMNDLEAKDAADLIMIYRELCELNTPVQKMINFGCSKGIEGVKKLTLAKPYPEIIDSLEDSVRDIIRARGSRILQEKWNVNQSEKSIAPQFPKKPFLSAQSIDFDPTSQMLALERNFDPSVCSISDIDNLDFFRPSVTSAPDKSQMNNDKGQQKHYSVPNQISDFHQAASYADIGGNITRAKNISSQSQIMEEVSYRPSPSTQRLVPSTIDQLLMENLDLTRGYSNDAPLQWDNNMQNLGGSSTVNNKSGYMGPNKQNNPFM